MGAFRAINGLQKGPKRHIFPFSLEKIAVLVRPALGSILSASIIDNDLFSLQCVSKIVSYFALFI